MKGSGCIILLSPLISVISRLFFIWKGETSRVNFFEQVDLISAMTNSEARDHLLGALPTGYGKSLPMLVASLLLPPGIECENLLAVLKFDFHRLDNCCHLSFDHHCPTAHERLQQVRHQRSCWTSGMWQSSIQLKIFWYPAFIRSSLRKLRLLWKPIDPEWSLPMWSS